MTYLKGAHSVFYAALLKEETPILYNLYKQVNPDVWKKWVELSNGLMFISDKPLLKTCFYAALNGGSISSEYDCRRHLIKVKETDPLFKRKDTSFLRHPITAEILKVASYWESLKGVLYVPTRQDPVKRFATKTDIDKRLKQLNEAYTGRNLEIPSEKLISTSTPMPRRLPTLYFTSLEVMYMSKLVGLVVSKSYDDNLLAVPVQGIHDGFMFLVPHDFPVEQYTQFINETLGAYAVRTMGLPLSVSVTTVTDADVLSEVEIGITEV